MPRSRENIAGVVGLGIVGGALAAYLHEQGVDVRAYDPPKGHADIAALDDATTIFVCVPTPHTPGIGFDDRQLLAAVRSLPEGKAVVIKSTVLPGTTARLQNAFPAQRFMFNPEFLREASAYEDFVRPDRQIVGVTTQSKRDASAVMEMLPRAPFELVCRSDEAEMAKYAANSFLAVKVIFANELFDLCARLGIDYTPVSSMVAADARIGGSHMDVHHDGYRGYGGKCLPKDSKALLDLARASGVDMRVLAAADAVNAGLRAVPPAERANVRILHEFIAAEERAA